jgi:phosphatidylserine decarboxylase
MKWKLTIQPRWLPLKSNRKKVKITGEIQVKAGLADPASPNATKEELQATWEKFIGTLERETSGGIQAIIDVPATESVGVGMILADTFTIGQHSADDFDEEMSCSETEDAAEKKKRRRRIRGLRRKAKQPFEFVQGVHDVMGVVFMEVQGARDLPPERNGTLFCGCS